MSFGVSAGVYSREIDKSNYISSIATSSAGIVGYSVKGDTTQIKLMTSTQQFIAEYGEPVLGNYFHYSALAYLEQGNQLYCYRVHNGALYGGVIIRHSTSAEANVGLGTGYSTPELVDDSAQDNLLDIFGKDQGTWNNNLAVRIENSDVVDYTFDIVVYLLDADSGTYSEQERWTVSRKQQIDGYGAQQYLETKINGFSDYIIVSDNTNIADSVMPKAQVTSLALTGGTNGDTPTDAQYILGWAEFINPDVVDVRLLIGAGLTSVAVQNEMKLVAETRKDCMAILDMPYAQLSSVGAMNTWRTDTQNFNSSYTCLYAPWVKIYDPYNGQLVAVPPSGYEAAQMAYTDYNFEVHYAPAGTNRGILNVLGVCDANQDSIVFTEGERDLLYANGINPIQVFKSRGNILWGQKTQQVKASALDRINVRRLLIVLEKSISVGLLDFVFDPNSEITRLKITSMIEEYLDTMSAKGAFQTEDGTKGYKVVCDTTNNTPATIDQNKLIVDVYVKPSRAAEYVRLNTVIVNSSATFSELVARGSSF